jgi:hypothetical protein
MGLLKVVRENKIPEEVPGAGPPALLLVFYFPTNPLVEILNDKVSQQPHPQGDGACDSSSHFWADHNRHID